MLAMLLAVAISAEGLPAGVRANAVPHLEHVVVVVLENKEYGDVVGNSDAPNFARFARAGVLLNSYTAIRRASLPNYLALVSGSTQGIVSNCTSCQVDAPSLADSLERAGLTWKTYAEDLPRAGYTDDTAGRYAKKHNPFMYFRAIATDPTRVRKIVPFSILNADLHARRLPTFALVIPNLCHDMHDCSVDTGDKWLGAFLRSLFRSRALGTGAVFVVFDEGRTTVGGGGHVPALLLGSAVRSGARFATRIDHYSLLRTVEQALRLPLLGHSADARPITGVWRRSR